MPFSHPFSLQNLPWEQLYVLHHPTTTVFSANKTRPRLSLGAIKWLACYHVPAGVTPPKNFVQGFGCCKPSASGEVAPPPASSDDVTGALVRAYAELDSAEQVLTASTSSSQAQDTASGYGAAVAAAKVTVGAALQRFNQYCGSMAPLRQEREEFEGASVDDMFHAMADDEEYMHAMDEVYGYPDE